MSHISRRIESIVRKDLKKKMVFLSGPRQCGKTTLAKDLLEPFAEKSYYNWDLDSDRKALLKSQINPGGSLWIFDEIHKNRRWRNWLKGIYDTQHDLHQILVTGSARLDLYSRGGDSLQGRYFSHKLYPVTLSELAGIAVLGDPLEELSDQIKAPSRGEQELLQSLLRLGGFPEPLVSGSALEADRWRLSYGTRLVREEVTSLEQVQDLARMELLFDHLPQTVGSVLSINSLREDLDVSFNTVKKWIEIFEKLYGVFRIYPFGPHVVKAVKKEAKIYFWDWGQVPSESARFENLVALHMMRWICWMKDVWGQKYELRYFRTVLGHEVDFIILKNGKPVLAVEVKLEDRPLDGGLKYLLERINIPQSFQISLYGQQNFQGPQFMGGRPYLTPAVSLLRLLP